MNILDPLNERLCCALLEMLCRQENHLSHRLNVLLYIVLRRLLPPFEVLCLAHPPKRQLYRCNVMTILHFWRGIGKLVLSSYSQSSFPWAVLLLQTNHGVLITAKLSEFAWNRLWLGLFVATWRTYATVSAWHINQSTLIRPLSTSPLCPPNQAASSQRAISTPQFCSSKYTSTWTIDHDTFAPTPGSVAIQDATPSISFTAVVARSARKEGAVVAKLSS